MCLFNQVFHHVDKVQFPIVRSTPASQLKIKKTPSAALSTSVERSFQAMLRLYLWVNVINLIALPPFPSSLPPIPSSLPGVPILLPPVPTLLPGVPSSLPPVPIALHGGRTFEQLCKTFLSGACPAAKAGCG